MPDFDQDLALQRLTEMQAAVRDAVVGSRDAKDLHAVAEVTDADTIYAIDAVVEPIILEHCRAWAREQPMTLIAEGVKRDDGTEGPVKLGDGEPVIRVILDPIDGTRGIMYDKRSAWALGGVAPERGEATRLRDISVGVMTELPTSKMGHADTLTAIRGRGARGVRVNLADKTEADLPIRPSTADTILHGFASVSAFFTQTMDRSAELMKRIEAEVVGDADPARSSVFNDQYISTGGQWYELIVGHDRFNADLRPAFYKMSGNTDGGGGLCCHPYDCATLIVAEEAGAIITDAHGDPLDSPLDTTTGLDWIAYANPDLRAKIEPVIRDYLTTQEATA